jgi:hypothetical protein
MKKLAFAALAVAPLLFGCAAPGPVSGPPFAKDFTFEVKDVGGDTAMVYLSSRKNVADPDCVTVAIERRLLKDLKARYGDNLETAFLGKTVHVQGEVQQYRRIEPEYDHPNGPVYFRSLVVPKSADEIKLI